MRMPGVMFAAGRTARAVSYAQAMAHAGIIPGSTVIFGEDPAKRQTAPAWTGPGCDGLFLPDLSVTLEQTISLAGWDMERLPVGSVNDPAILELIRSKRPEFVIYAGYGGQIVSVAALCEARFLHIHSGLLPGFRGSTTIYYSILSERQVGASAILLEPSIDTGPVVMSKKYPLPPYGMNVDLLYDTAVRADLLVETLKIYMRDGRLPECQGQNHDDGRDYYVVHPVLKHIALLSLK